MATSKHLCRSFAPPSRRIPTVPTRALPMNAPNAAESSETLSLSLAVSTRTLNSPGREAPNASGWVSSASSRSFAQVGASPGSSMRMVKEIAVSILCRRIINQHDLRLTFRFPRRLTECNAIQQRHLQPVVGCRSSSFGSRPERCAWRKSRAAGGGLAERRQRLGRACGSIGGLDGDSFQDITIKSTGQMTVDAGQGMTEITLSPDALKMLAALVQSSKFSKRILPSNNPAGCYDCSSTAVTVRRREPKGKDRTYSAAWVPTTVGTVSEDFVSIVRQVLGLSN